MDKHLYMSGKLKRKEKKSVFFFFFFFFFFLAILAGTLKLFNFYFIFKPGINNPFNWTVECPDCICAEE